MNVLSDEYLYALMEQGQESDVVGECDYCYQELFADEDVFTDNEGNTFCELECALKHYGIKQVVLEKREEF